MVAVGKGGIAAAVRVGGADSALGFWGVLETRLWALDSGRLGRRRNFCAKVAVATLITY